MNCYDNFTDNAHVRAESPGGAPSTCADNTVVTDGNWPPAAKAIMDAAGPNAGVYYTCRPDGIMIGGSKGNGDFFPRPLGLDGRRSSIKLGWCRRRLACR